MTVAEPAAPSARPSTSWLHPLRDSALRRARELGASARRAARDPHLWALTVAVALYTVYWSELTNARFLALHADVLDLGVYFQASWAVVHGPFTPTALWATFATEGILFVAFPLTLPGSYPFLLVAQSFLLGVCAFPLYAVARRLLRSRPISLLFALSYLLYFPLAGINFFDVHTEAYFVPLFLFGYWAHLTGRPRVAYALLFLSGLSRFPFALYPALFASVRLAERVWPRLPSRPDPSPKYPARYDLGLLGASAVVLLVSVAYFLVNASTLSGFLHTTSASAQPPFDARALAVILFLAPFLFLPAFSPRWGLFLWMGLGLLFAAGTHYYVYPYVFFTQYSAPILPFVFLGLLDATLRLFPMPRRRPATAPPPSLERFASTRRAEEFLRVRREGTVVVAFAVVVAFGLVWQPWGIWNPQVGASFNLPVNTGVNQTLFDAATQVINLIPPNAGNVLIQNNLPQVLPRPIGNNGTVLVAGNTLAYNFTYLYRNAWLPAVIDYVVMDPYSYLFTYTGPFPYNLSMAQAVNDLYGSGGYGVVAEAYGIILLERNYQGSLQFYRGQNLSFPASSLSVTVPSYERGSAIVAENVTNQTTVWFGPYAFVQPGLYRLTYTLKASNVSATNHVRLDVLVGAGATAYNSTTLEGPSLAPAGTWVRFSELVYVDNVYPSLNLPGNDVGWSGTLELSGITVEQLAPANTTYRPGFGAGDQAAAALVHLVPVNATVLVQPDVLSFVVARRHVVSTSFDPSTAVWPTYLLGDPYRSAYTQQAAAPTESLYALTSLALTQKGFHTVGLIDGVYLLSSDPTVPLRSYVGYNASYPASELFVTNATFWTGSEVRGVDVTSHTTVWFGPYQFLPAGTYRLSYEMRASNLSASNSLRLDVLVDGVGAPLATHWLYGPNLTAPNAWTNVSFTVVVPGYYASGNFPANDVDWTGSIELSAISLTQLAPP